jgi:hypothetical protein
MSDVDDVATELTTLKAVAVEMPKAPSLASYPPQYTFFSASSVEKKTDPLEASSPIMDALTKVFAILSAILIGGMFCHMATDTYHKGQLLT